MSKQTNPKDLAKIIQEAFNGSWKIQAETINLNYYTENGQVIKTPTLYDAWKVLKDMNTSTSQDTLFIVRVIKKLKALNILTEDGNATEPTPSTSNAQAEESSIMTYEKYQEEVKNIREIIRSEIAKNSAASDKLISFDYIKDGKMINIKQTVVDTLVGLRDINNEENYKNSQFYLKKLKETLEAPRFFNAEPTPSTSNVQAAESSDEQEKSKEYQKFRKDIKDLQKAMQDGDIKSELNDILHDIRCNPEIFAEYKEAVEQLKNKWIARTESASSTSNAHALEVSNEHEISTPLAGSTSDESNIDGGL